MHQRRTPVPKPHVVALRDAVASASSVRRQQLAPFGKDASGRAHVCPETRAKRLTTDIPSTPSSLARVDGGVGVKADVAHQQREHVPHLRPFRGAPPVASELWCMKIQLGLYIQISTGIASYVGVV